MPLQDEKHPTGALLVFSFWKCICRKDTLRAITINVAHMWHEENRMGSLETGKLANLTVFDKDFMRDDFADIENAKCLATYVDGELVYKA